MATQNPSAKPNLKPFRDYDEHDVVNLYAHQLGAVNRGTFVKLVTGADPDDHSAWGNNNLQNSPSNVVNLRHIVNWKVATAGSGDVVFGMTLYDVAEVTEWGDKLQFQPAYKAAELNTVVSGRAVPIARRGMFEINGFSGTPDAGSGAAIHDVTAGQLKITTNPQATDNVGIFLSQSGADGYALFLLDPK